MPTVKPTRLSPPRVLLSSTLHPGADGNLHVGASTIYRFAAPGDALRRTGYAATLLNYQLPALEKIQQLAPDSIIMKHFFTDACIEEARVYRKYKQAFIGFEIDDLFWDLDDANPNKQSIPVDVLQRMRRTVAQSDATIVSTPILAEHVHKSLGIPHASIRIVRNQLPQAFITTAIAVRGNRPARKDTRPRVGWAGGASHPGDLAILTDVVNNTADRIQWVFMGALPPGISPSQVEFHRAVPYSQYSTQLALLDLDLAVAPLMDTPFNSCKSDLRVLEYGACGYPVLTSTSPAFADVPDIASTCTNSAAAWESAIFAALGDTAWQDESAQKLHDWVKAQRVIESQSNLDRWIWAWSDDSKEMFRPGNSDTSPLPAVIVGEPVSAFDLSTYPTIQAAAVAAPKAPIVYIRPGCVPTTEQIAVFLDQSEKGQHLSACALSNDGDYPAPGHFMPLAGKVMDDMAEAALNLYPEDANPVQVGYSVGPLQYLSTKALSTVGYPDENRYKGDSEIAIIDWCLRLQDMGGHDHAVFPNLFVGTNNPGKQMADPDYTKLAFSEMATWHPTFPEIMRQLTSTDRFSHTRQMLDLSYTNISYEAPLCSDYVEWSSMHDSTTPEMTAWHETVLLALGNKPPVISIVMPVYNTPPALLKEAIDSVIAQLYPHWHLIIVDDASTNEDTLAVLKDHEVKAEKRILIVTQAVNGHISNASNAGLAHCKGTWVTFLDHDDILPLYTLTTIASAIHDNPTANLFYGDSDMLDPTGKLHSPDFKPDFDYDLLLAQNYTCHPTVYRRDGLKDIGGFNPAFDGSQDYDLSLRYIEHLCWKDTGVDRDKIHHIPLVLYHWRQSPDSVSTDIANKPYALEAGRKAVFAHLTRTKRLTFLGPHPRVPLHHLVRFLPPDTTPKVTVIILTQTNRKQLENCLHSIFKLTSYSNYNVVVRQVGEDASITEGLRQLNKRYPKLSYVSGGGDVAFNFALLNNTVVDAHTSIDTKVLVFLNDDTEIIEPAWLNDLVGTAMRSDVGAVGVKLIYPNKQVQHNGITIDFTSAVGEFALHAHRGVNVADVGPFGRAAIAHQAIAVTGACLAIRREVFLSIGGFDAEHFPLDYNDVDLCFRLYESGLSNVVLSHMPMIHLEGGTKRTKPEQVHRSGMLQSESTIMHLHVDKIKCDPYSNPNKMHDPTGMTVRLLPPRPWRKEGVLPRTIIVGGSKEDASTLFQGGELPFIADPDGPFLRLSSPTCEHGGVVDLRDFGGFLQLLDRLNINRIVLRRLGSGSAETVLGAIVHAHDVGGIALDYWPASFESVCPRLDCINSQGACGHLWKTNPEACQACIDRDGSPYGFVSVIGWRMAWARFNTSLTGNAKTPSAE